VSATAESYRLVEEVARARARNFYYSFLVLPPEKRRALCAVYAFMRQCDDISDGDGSTETRRRRLDEWRKQLDGALAGETCASAILPAFVDAVERFRIPSHYFHRVIDGAEMDLSIGRYDSFEELYRYCFNVASAVGLVCIEIFGYRDARAREHAEHCGIAFQLTNILRDVQEDAAMGRIYLPQEDLRRFGYSPEDLRRGIFDERFRSLMDFEASRALEYYRDARNLLPLVDRESRASLWAMMEIYERVLRKIARRKYNVFAGVVRVPAAEKAAIVLQALALRLVASSDFW